MQATSSRLGKQLFDHAFNLNRGSFVTLINRSFGKQVQRSLKDKHPDFNKRQKAKEPRAGFTQPKVYWWRLKDSKRKKRKIGPPYEPKNSTSAVV